MTGRGLACAAIALLGCSPRAGRVDAEPPAIAAAARPRAPAIARLQSPAERDASHAPIPPPPELDPEPLPADAAAILLGSPEDEPAEARGGVTPDRRGKHYLASNEKWLSAFYESVRDRGGGYVGVGSDQAYLLVGWIRPEIAWLVDYDPDVVAVHAVYRALIDDCETPDDLVARWSKPGRDDALAAIDAAFDGDDERAAMRRLYLSSRGWIERRLLALRERLTEAGIPSWLSDQATYDHVRALLQAGRVRPLLANLLDDRGIVGVGEAARRLGVPITVLYLSNAEEYWQTYDRQFRVNVAALPFSADAIVLRTLLIWDVNGDYRYNVQPADNYLRWLSRGFTRNVYDIVHDRPPATREGLNFFTTDSDPDASPAARRGT